MSAVREQSQETAGPDMFAPDGYRVVDLFGWVDLSRDLTLRAGVLNMADTKYFQWPHVRGRAADDPVIDRYSSPGVAGTVSLSYRW